MFMDELNDDNDKEQTHAYLSPKLATINLYSRYVSYCCTRREVCL